MYINITFNGVSQIYEKGEFSFVIRALPSVCLHETTWFRQAVFSLSMIILELFLTW
jgi:hypothetical protein